MRVNGKIVSWNDAKGFGFVEPRGGGERVFVHIKSFNRQGARPAQNQLLSYSLSADKRGRPCAVSVMLAPDQGALPSSHRVRRQPYPGLPVMVAAVFLIIAVVAGLSEKIPLLVAQFYLAVSLFTFIVYAVDKSAANNGTWRVPESKLHLLAAVGGWPGAVLARHWLRHKSSKPAFRSVLWLTVVLNCAAFVGLFSATGAAMLQSVMAAVA